MLLIDEGQAEVLDDVMTMAAGLCKTAYQAGATEVHFAVNRDSVVVLIATDKGFNLPMYEAAHPSFPLKVDPAAADKAQSNGKGGKYYCAILSYDVLYCNESSPHEMLTPSGQVFTDELYQQPKMFGGILRADSQDSPEAEQGDIDISGNDGLDQG